MKSLRQVISHFLWNIMGSFNNRISLFPSKHYNDIIMGTMASKITSLRFVYSTVYSDENQRKHQSSASLAFVWGIHRGQVNSPHKWPVTRKMFPFDDVIMKHPIAHLQGKIWGVFWELILWYPPLPLPYYVQNYLVIDFVITILDCILLHYSCFTYSVVPL